MRTDKISTHIACNMRLHGLYLPTNRYYENERILEIAIRQEKLIEEFNILDEELLKLDENYNK